MCDNLILFNNILKKRVTVESASQDKIITHIDGSFLINMISSALSLMESNVNEVNELNVFPVPDGDTGTNMYLTIQSVTQDLEKIEGDIDLNKVTDIIAKSALMGARGNSGVILSQFLGGISKVFSRDTVIDLNLFIDALEVGAQEARKAVANPVEGTMLTVLTDVAMSISNQKDISTNFVDLFDLIYKSAFKSVEETPTKLQILADAGVVDSGGAGLVVIFDAWLRFVKDNKVFNEIVIPLEWGKKRNQDAIDDFFVSVDHEEYGFCTQFVVIGDNLDVDTLRDNLSQMADSCVVVGDLDRVQVHVHTSDSDSVITYSKTIGEVIQIRIQDMDKQKDEFRETLKKPSKVDMVNESKVSVIPVVLGDGMSDVFRDLGVFDVCLMKKTMNPSVAELNDIVELVPGSDVILLPNNKNVIPVAEAVAKLSKKNIKVLPTITMPQGITAMVGFDREKDLLANFEEMEQLFDELLTVEIHTASRNVEFNGVNVKEGDIIAVTKEEILTNGEDVYSTVINMFSQIDLDDYDIITFYRGSILDEEECEEIVAKLHGMFPDLEFETVEGGQPNNHLIISLE